MKTNKNALGSIVVVAAVAFFTAIKLDAASITVTSTNDSGPNTLRAALASAGNGDTIAFSLTLPATIPLTSGERVVSKSVTILGSAPANLKVDGNAASRVFDVQGGVTATISGLTINNGFAYNDYGGGVLK